MTCNSNLFEAMFHLDAMDCSTNNNFIDHTEKSTDSAKPQSNADKPVPLLTPTDWQEDMDNIQPQTRQKFKCKISRDYLKSSLILLIITSLKNYFVTNQTPFQRFGA